MSLRNLIAVFVIGSLALGLLGAGCGGSNDGDQIDKATFIKQANEICEQASGKLSAVITSIGNRASTNPNADPTKTRIATVTEGLIPSLEEELEKIRAMGVPEEAQSEVEALLKAYRKAIDRTKANARVVALTEKLAPHEEIAVAATRFGVTECPISPVNVPTNAGSGGE
jgi:hypothetical protein